MDYSLQGETPKYPIGKSFVLATKKDVRFLQKAIEIAALSECRVRHGAVVVKHSKILGSSPNIYKNNPKNISNIQKCSVHAEIAALKKANFPTCATIYVARINSFNERRLSMPCKDCFVEIERLRCRVVWTLNE